MEGMDFRIWIYASAAILIGLCYPVLMIHFLVSSVHPQKNSFDSPFSSSFACALREQMRATGSSLLWGMLFILPGFVRYFQLLFVPMVALAHPQYAQGEIDALTVSRKLVRTQWKKLLGLVIVFTIILPVLLSSFDEYKIFSRSLWTALPLSLLESFLSLIFISLIWILFLKAFNMQHNSQEKKS